MVILLFRCKTFGLNTSFRYAHHHNLPNPITSYEAGAPVTFHVLYQHPMVNTIFVSLKTNARLGEKQVIEL